jgi:DNA adenine methylase
VKPPVPYFGSKAKLGPKIAALLPEHTSYVEPYAGSLAVLFAKEPEPIEVVNDLNRDLTTFWRVLRDRPDEMLWRAETTPHSRIEFQSAGRGELDELEVAWSVWVRLTQGRSGLTHGTGWRTNYTPGSASMTLPAYMSRYRSRLWEAIPRLQNVTIENLDALEVIRRYGVPGAVIYADPPYIQATRVASRNRYEVEVQEEHHAALITALEESPASVVLSGYEHPMYDLSLPEWERVEHSVLSQRAQRTEVIWVKHV